MLILDLWGISFHPVVFVGLGNDLLFNFIVGHCVVLLQSNKFLVKFPSFRIDFIQLCPGTKKVSGTPNTSVMM